MTSALVSAFQDVDVEKTGVIKTSELRTALQLVGQNPSAEEVTQLAEKAGRNIDTCHAVMYVVINLRKKAVLGTHSLYGCMAKKQPRFYFKLFNGKVMKDV